MAAKVPTFGDYLANASAAGGTPLVQAVGIFYFTPTLSYLIRVARLFMTFPTVTALQRHLQANTALRTVELNCTRLTSTISLRRSNVRVSLKIK